MRDIPRLDNYHLYERYAGEDGDADHARAHRDFEWQVPDRFNLAEYVCDRWAADGEATALYVDGFEGADERVTFRRLRQVSNALAGYLLERGLDRGDRIAVCAPQRPETIASHVAAWKIGAISVPLSTLSGTDGLRYRLRDSGAEALVTVPSVAERIPADVIDGLTVLTLERATPAATEPFDAALDAGRAVTEPVRTDPEDPAMINYTSGTTGDPKGVVHAHQHLLGVLPTFCTAKLDLQAPRGDVTRTVVDWSWTGAFNNTVLPSLYFGIPVVGAAGRFDPAAEFELIEEYGITLYNCPPTAVRKMMDEAVPDDEYAVDTVRTVAVGGEPVDRDVLEWALDRFGDVVVHEVYGQTEAPTFVGDCTALGVEHRPGRMGRASPGHAFRGV
jgi:acetyl-CoA synthetase